MKKVISAIICIIIILGANSYAAGGKSTTDKTNNSLQPIIYSGNKAAAYSLPFSFSPYLVTIQRPDIERKKFEGLGVRVVYRF